jgi:hypothetical protein
MIFLNTFWIYLIGAVVACTPGQPRRQRIGAIALVVLLVLVYLQLLSFVGPQTIAGDATNYTPALIFFLGLAGSLFFTAVLVLQRRTGKSSHGRTGTAVFAAVAGIYLMFTAVDHWWFFRGDDEKTGWASPSSMGVNDMDCDFALVRLRANDMEYRCAHFFVFGKFYAHPFVPWPSYTSGTSVDLKTKNDEFEREAIRPTPSGESQPK